MFPVAIEMRSIAFAHGFRCNDGHAAYVQRIIRTGLRWVEIEITVLTQKKWFFPKVYRETLAPPCQGSLERASLYSIAWIQAFVRENICKIELIAKPLVYWFLSRSYQRVRRSFRSFRPFVRSSVLSLLREREREREREKEREGGEGGFVDHNL